MWRPAISRSIALFALLIATSLANTTPMSRAVVTCILCLEILTNITDTIRNNNQAASLESTHHKERVHKTYADKLVSILMCCKFSKHKDPASERHTNSVEKLYMNVRRYNRQEMKAALVVKNFVCIWALRGYVRVHNEIIDSIKAPSEGTRSFVDFQSKEGLHHETEFGPSFVHSVYYLLSDIYRMYLARLSPLQLDETDTALEYLCYIIIIHSYGYALSLELVLYKQIDSDGYERVLGSEDFMLVKELIDKTKTIPIKDETMRALYHKIKYLQYIKKFRTIIKSREMNMLVFDKPIIYLHTIPFGPFRCSLSIASRVEDKWTGNGVLPHGEQKGPIYVITCFAEVHIFHPELNEYRVCEWTEGSSVIIDERDKLIQLCISEPRGFTVITIASFAQYVLQHFLKWTSPHSECPVRWLRAQPQTTLKIQRICRLYLYKKQYKGTLQRVKSVLYVHNYLTLLQLLSKNLMTFLMYNDSPLFAALTDCIKQMMEQIKTLLSKFTFSSSQDELSDEQSGSGRGGDRESKGRGRSLIKSNLVIYYTSNSKLRRMLAATETTAPFFEIQYITIIPSIRHQLEALLDALALLTDGRVTQETELETYVTKFIQYCLLLPHVLMNYRHFYYADERHADESVASSAVPSDQKLLSIIINLLKKNYTRDLYEKISATLGMETCEFLLSYIEKCVNIGNIQSLKLVKTTMNYSNTIIMETSDLEEEDSQLGVADGYDVEHLDQYHLNLCRIEALEEKLFSHDLFAAFFESYSVKCIYEELCILSAVNNDLILLDKEQCNILCINERVFIFRPDKADKIPGPISCVLVFDMSDIILNSIRLESTVRFSYAREEEDIDVELYETKGRLTSEIMKYLNEHLEIE